MTQTANEAGIVTFKYEKPEVLDAPKKHVHLVRSGVLGFNIQVLKDGGETNLHAHAGEDAAWFVLGGRVRFYDTEERVAFEAGRHEGIAIPKGSPYWFESASEEPLEIIRISARDPFIRNDRLNFNALRERQAGQHDETLVTAEAAANAKPMQAIKYDGSSAGQGLAKLWETELLNVAVHTVEGDTGVQTDADKDATWFVLKGSARVESGGESWELGEQEGVFIPQETEYRVRSTGTTAVEIMQVTVRTPKGS